jgi:hypothetical protein
LELNSSPCFSFLFIIFFECLRQFSDISFPTCYLPPGPYIIQTLPSHIQNEVKTPINCLCVIVHVFCLDLAQWIDTETRHMYTLEVRLWYECVSVNHNIWNLWFVSEVTHGLSLSMYKLLIIHRWFGRTKCLKWFCHCAVHIRDW